MHFIVFKKEVHVFDLILNSSGSCDKIGRHSKLEFNFIICS